ncbi:MAG: dethiobiotin synthase [Arcobacteraceae bacterium]|nr:dethiobiotin synthase [Arcobacteraceae bacterium]
MKEIYFITATNTDVGKTKASEVFLRKFAKDGKRVGYLKPIETGVDGTPLDGGYLLNLTKELNSSFDVDLNDVVPLQFKLPAAPFVSSGGVDIDINIIKEKVKYLLNYCDVLIVEGAGGLMVPINKDYFMIDLIKDIDPTQTILISPSHLGSINDTLLSQNVLTQYGIKFDWYINLYKDINEFEKITLPFYKAYFDKIGYLQDI